MSLLLAVDLGTSSTRATLYESDTMTVVPGAAQHVVHEPVHGPDGSAILDADALVAEVVSCIEKALASAGGREVVGVGFSCFWHSTVGIDGAGAAVTPVLLWSDTRSSPQVARLREAMDVLAYSQRTGCPLHTSYLPGRLLWLSETHPEMFAASVRFVSPAEYIFGKLFGVDKVTCSVSMASGTGLLDQAGGVWDTATLSHIPGLTPQRLSPIDDAPASGLRAPYRVRLAALASVPWFPALGDGACSNVGCGATRPGTIALMIGTSGAVRVVVPGVTPPALPSGLWRYQIDHGRYILGGALSNGGSVWAWLKKTIHLPDASDDAIEAALGTLPPDGHGLTVLPFLAGERAPLWRDDLRATIHGLTAATTPLEIVRAHLEAVALRFAAIREALRPVAANATVIGTGAGLIASPVWAQIISDALGEPIEVSGEEQASSRGAAIRVREWLKLGKIEEAPPVAVSQTVTPDPARTTIYRVARDRQEALLARLL